VILERGQLVGPGSLPQPSRGILERIGADDHGALPSLEGVEERYIRHVLRVTESVEEAADVLRVAPSTLWRRRRKYGI
jgi:transcriptional regulator with PAS, ATPase and Fis domain